MIEFFKNKKDDILDFILKYHFIISIIITIIVLVMFYGEIERSFSNSKTDILNMTISTSGTIFGFILTFLSILLVFRTDKKYKKNDKNKNKPIIMLTNNNSFNYIYELCIESSYSLGVLLVISIIYYFANYGFYYIINSICIVIICELIILGIIRVFLLVCVFNMLIRILIIQRND